MHLVSNINRIRNRKVTNKVSDVFSCLNREVKEEVKPETSNHPIFFLQQKTLFLKGKLVKQKKLKRLVKLYKLYNEPIPEILKEYDTDKPRHNLKHRRKHQKLTNKKIPKGRVPRTYKVYIKSKYWDRRKNLYYRTHIKQCAVCRGYNLITIHHLDYISKEFGNEKDSDLVAICWECHKEFHNEYGVTKNSHKMFAEFCANKVNNPVV